MCSASHAAALLLGLVGSGIVPAGDDRGGVAVVDLRRGEPGAGGALVFSGP